MNSYTEENYLKAIYKIREKSGSEVTTNEIAAVMNTKAASVTDMLKRLAEKKLINYVKYQGVTLTNEGVKVAINTIRKHRLWEVFLVDQLKFKWDEVHDIAEELEHINSEKLIDSLDDFLGNPKFDPHGDPIPSKSGIFANKKVHLLFELKDKAEGVVSGVSDHSNLFLQYLDKIKVRLGTKIKVLEKNEYDDSMNIKIDDHQPIQISKEVSKNILISIK
jgi:DtxR family transcriptional regulator, Mn-dependent transcriptional regulator